MVSQLTISPQEKAHFKIRLLWFFSVATGAALLFYFFENFVFFPNQPILLSEVQQYYRAFFFLLPLMLFLTVLLVLLGDWSERYILIFELSVTLMTAFILIFLLLLRPTPETRLFPLLLLLLCHAVFVPCRTWGQSLLTTGVLVAFLLGHYLVDGHLSQTQKILLSENDDGSGYSVPYIKIIQITLVGLLSIWITHLLSRARAIKFPMENRIGNYEIIKEVGSGGMGKVYLAKHILMGRLAALKILEPKTEGLKSCVKRFEQEVKLSSKLNHPNTIVLYDFGIQEKGNPYYSMEWLEGMDLRRMVEQMGPLSVPRTIYVLSQVCASLAEAHANGVIHRDIKPGNIFLTHRGGIYDFVKVLDFGLAKDLMKRGDHQLTQEGLFLGTPLFVAPEIVFEKSNIDERTDIYMLGCCAYWILTGHAPFSAKNDEELILAHANYLPDPISKWQSNIPEDLEKIILQCLEKLPQDRFQNIGELAEALMGLAEEYPWSPEDAEDWWTTHLTTDSTHAEDFLRTREV